MSGHLGLREDARLGAQLAAQIAGLFLVARRPPASAPSRSSLFSS